MHTIDYIDKYYRSCLVYISEYDQYNYHLEVNLIEDIPNHIFYKYPLQYNTYINRIGCIYDNGIFRYKHIQYCNTDYNRYPTVRVRGVTNNIHSMLARTFLNYTNGYVVNHIDGNKSNFELSNLEVVTVSDNNKHAMRTGLNANSSIHPIRPLVVKCLNTGITREYNSIGELADCIKLSVSTIHEHINKCNNPGYIKSRNIIVKYKR